MRLDVGLHLADELGRFGDVAGDRAELLDLGVGVVERRRRRAFPTVDAERFELGRERRRRRTSRRVGLVAGDRFDVRREAGEVGRTARSRPGSWTGRRRRSTWSPAPMANSISVAVGDSDTMRCGHVAARAGPRRRSGRRRVDAGAVVAGAVDRLGGGRVAVAADVVAVVAAASSSSPPHAAASSSQAGDDAGGHGPHGTVRSSIDWRTSTRQRLREPPLPRGSGCRP